MQGDADLFLVDRMLHNNFFIRGGYCTGRNQTLEPPTE
jgi:hypothetical protein